MASGPPKRVMGGVAQDDDAEPALRVEAHGVPRPASAVSIG